MADLTHLHVEARPLALLPATERLDGLRSDRWFGYGRANAALAALDDLLRHEPGRLRPRNLLIVGPSNNGKTMIAEKFRRAHPQRISDDGDHEEIPVLSIEMPPQPTVSRFHTAVLEALKVPVGHHGGADRKESFVIRLMRACKVRLLIIDELHNMLGAFPLRQRELLNLLRYLGNTLRIPIVCLGTREAYLAIRTDDQLENRFHPFVLPPWENDAELGRLLASFEATLPLREPSGLAAPGLRDLILRRSEGLIGEIATLLARAAAAALSSGHERLDAALLQTPAYEPPTRRRRLAERALR